MKTEHLASRDVITTHSNCNILRGIVIKVKPFWLCVGDFISGYVRSAWWELKGLSKGGQFPASFRAFSNECRDEENDKASKSWCQLPAWWINRCLQSSDFLQFATRTEPSEGSVSSVYVYSVIVCKLLVHSIIHACVQCVTPLNSLAGSWVDPASSRILL